MKKTIEKEFGDRITGLRKQTGLAQSDLAFECDLAPSRLSNYENGISYPPLDIIVKIGSCLDKYLGTGSLVYIMTGQTIMQLAGKSDEEAKRFTPEKATALFEQALVKAQQLKVLKLKANFNRNELITSFSRSCGLVVNDADRDLQP